jgi:hypothetical protein
MPMETRAAYFKERGPQNTADTLRHAKARAEALGINDIVVASYSGDAGVKAAQLFRDQNLVIVAGVVGFKEPNMVSMRDENRALIERDGGRILYAGHAFGMLGRAVHRRFGAIQIDEVIAHVLRLFGTGVKVCCEITCMAADAGLIQAGEEVIAIAGTGRGLDTAIILKASNTHTFFDTRILEIVCKPR